MAGCRHASVVAKAAAKARSLLINARLCLRRYSIVEAEVLMRRTDRLLALVEALVSEANNCQIAVPEERRGILRRLMDMLRL